MVRPRNFSDRMDSQSPRMSATQRIRVDAPAMTTRVERWAADLTDCGGDMMPLLLETAEVMTRRDDGQCGEYSGDCCKVGTNACSRVGR